MTSLKEQVLDLSRQARIAPLTIWFDEALDSQIEDGIFMGEADIAKIGSKLIQDLQDYADQTGTHVVVLGMSGGVDSALTAALFKDAGYRVIGVTMPIHQDPIETERGIEACQALGIEHIHKDLSALYDEALKDFGDVDSDLNDDNAFDSTVKIRRGNIRARLRMITLYNIASKHRGFVASTDNFSELAAGFWTLHGDVGDVAPIQSLMKSWEVPMLSKIVGVPEKTWRATPTDGLGIDNGDEAQLGATYLEWDIMQREVHKAVTDKGLMNLDDIASNLQIARDDRAIKVFRAVTSRMKGNWFKRMNPVRVDHPYEDRYMLLQETDQVLFQPNVVKGY